MGAGILTIGNIVRWPIHPPTQVPGEINGPQNLLQPVKESSKYLENTVWLWALCDIRAMDYDYVSIKREHFEMPCILLVRGLDRTYTNPKRSP